MINKIKQKIKNHLLRRLFNTLTVDDLLVYHNGKMYIGGKEISKDRKQSFISQAHTIAQLPLWEQLIKDMKVISNQRMFEKGTSVDDIMFGKAMLYTIDVMERKIANLRRLK